MSDPKKVITKEEWEKKLSDVKIAKEDMNRLVMNFFVTEGCVEAAEKFQMESGIEPTLDFASIMNRMAVKKAVEDGNIEDAIEKLNGWNPKILDTNPEVVFHLQQQRFIELIRNKKDGEALDFGQEELAPIVKENPDFLEEFQRTATLLAYEDADNCPVGELLEMSRRQKTASEVSAAILRSQRHEKDPLLCTMLKMLKSVQGKLGNESLFPVILDCSTAKLELLDS